jgi:hypothetical protein
LPAINHPASLEIEDATSAKVALDNNELSGSGFGLACTEASTIIAFLVKLPPPMSTPERLVMNGQERADQPNETARSISVAN